MIGLVENLQSILQEGGSNCKGLEGFDLQEGGKRSRKSKKTKKSKKSKKSKKLKKSKRKTHRKKR